jgi:putative DNA primase/helicase
MITAAHIAYQLGLTESGNGFSGFCPSCSYETGFCVTDKGGRLLVHCHAGGCTQQELIQALAEYGLWEDSPDDVVESAPGVPVFPPPPIRKTSSIELARAMWARSRPAHGTLVQTYLSVRGYRGAIPPLLHFVAGKHPSDGQFHPVMLAAAVVLSGDPLKFAGVHRTFLRTDGLGKAPLDPDKMTLGDIRGAGVPLANPGPKTAVSEGIETGLSFQQATGIPTLAALSAGGLQALLLPAVVQEVFIAADADPVGLKAAQAAARRWHDEGRTVRIVEPPTGQDFNDLARMTP